MERQWHTPARREAARAKQNCQVLVSKCSQSVSRIQGTMQALAWPKNKTAKCWSQSVVKSGEWSGSGIRLLGERHQGATTKPSSVRPTLPSLLSLLVLLCFLSFHCKLRWLMDPCSFSSAATATTSTWRVVDAATQRNHAWTQARNAEFARQGAF